MSIDSTLFRVPIHVKKIIYLICKNHGHLLFRLVKLNWRKFSKYFPSIFLFEQRSGMEKSVSRICNIRIRFLLNKPFFHRLFEIYIYFGDPAEKFKAFGGILVAPDMRDERKCHIICLFYQGSD